MVRKVASLVSAKKVEKPKKVKETKKPVKSTKQTKQTKPKKEEKKVKKVNKTIKKETKKTTKKPTKKIAKSTLKTKTTKTKGFKVTIGFIGIGTITTAIIKGLSTKLDAKVNIKQIIVSPRSEKNSKQLAKDYKSLVKRATTNQEVIDKSDWVVIGLQKAVVPEVCKALKFKKTQTLINLAAMPNDEFTKCVNQYKEVVVACPLPSVALHQGSTIICPPHKQVKTIFDFLGTCVAVNNQKEIYSLYGIPCLMGAQYQIMQTAFEWMTKKQKVNPETAKQYITATYNAIIADAQYKIFQHNSTFDHLVKEQTPGGMNEQNIKLLKDKKVFDSYKEVLESTYAKMSKK